MTLDSKLSKAVYQGNGSTTVFPFAFKVWDSSQIAVTVTDVAGVSTDVTSNSTVALTSSGGSVTYPKTGNPLPSGAKLAITRNMPFTQGINLVSASRFDPQVLEDGLDQATAERQQTLEMMARAVILPATSSESPETVVASIYSSRDAAAASADTASAQATAAQNSAQAASEKADESAGHAAAAAQSAENAAAASGGLAGRVDAVELKNTQQDTQIADVKTKNTQQDTRLTDAETALAGKANLDLSNATGNAIGQYLYVRDEKPSGTNGGATSSFSWHTRDLNTVKFNTLPGASLSANNRITLPAGRYLIMGRAPSYAADNVRAAIYNLTSATYVAYGSTIRGPNGSGIGIGVDTSVVGVIDLSTQSVVELRMWARTAYQDGLGFVMSGGAIPGVNEVYSELTIWKM